MFSTNFLKFLLRNSPKYFSLVFPSLFLYLVFFFSVSVMTASFSLLYNSSYLFTSLRPLSHLVLFVHARTHNKCYPAASPHWHFIFLTNFKISDFNKEHTSSLKMIRMMIETCWSVFKCFNMNI